MIDPTALIDESVKLGRGVYIWRHSHIRSGVCIGNGVIIGENVYLGPEVVIGDFSKIQNHAQIYEPAIIENGVFIGPGACLTNDKFPRAITAQGELKSFNIGKKEGNYSRRSIDWCWRNMCGASGDWSVVSHRSRRGCSRRYRSFWTICWKSSEKNRLG